MDRELHSCASIFEKIATKFELTEEEKYRLNPEGDKYLFSNCLEWALSILEEIDFLISPTRDQWKITKQGLMGLKTRVSVKEIETLRPQYNCDTLYSFHEYKHPNFSGIFRPATDEDLLKNSYNRINDALKQKLLENIQNNTPQFFERLVLQLLVKMGYGGAFSNSVATTKKTHDEGIDGIINRDRLGLDVIYIQAKRWKKVIGRPEIQKFVGALHGQGAIKGIFVTTSTYSSIAKNYIKNLALNLVLIDGQYLAQLMIEHNIGVYVKATYDIKAIDVDFFTYE